MDRPSSSVAIHEKHSTRDTGKLFQRDRYREYGIAFVYLVLNTVQLILPTLDEFPIFTPIPVSINIETTSKTMRREDTPENEPIFPAPPLTL